MITTTEKIRIFDDTGDGDDFEMSNLLYENNNVILCEVFNEWYTEPFTVLIYKNSENVVAYDPKISFDFYIAENFNE